jgi:hypothetical protein
LSCVRTLKFPTRPQFLILCELITMGVLAVIILNNEPHQTSSEHQMDSCDRSLHNDAKPRSAQDSAAGSHMLASLGFSFISINQQRFCVRKNHQGQMTYMVSLDSACNEDCWNCLYEEWQKFVMNNAANTSSQTPPSNQ